MMRRVTKIEIIFYIIVEGWNWIVRGGQLVAVVLIQCFIFGSREKATGQSVTER
jgi:hypothetical protein